MAPPSPASSRKRSPVKVFAIVAVGVFLTSLDLFIVNIAFPAIQRDFSGSGVSDVSWVLNSYAIVSSALLVPAGKLGDILGRRRVFVGGLLAFGAGSALCAAAPSLPLLIGARVLQGVGAAAVVPTSLGLLLPSIAPAQRAVAIGGWAAIGGVGAALGPPLGGFLTEIGWQWIFIVNVPLVVATAVAAMRALDEIRDRARPPLPDALGTALLIAASGLLTLGLVQGPGWGWDLRVIGSLIGSALLGAGFIWRSSRHPAPVLELSIVRVPAFALASLSAALFYAAFAAMLLASVIFLTDAWGYSALEAGLAITPGPLAAAAFAPVSGRLAGGFGPGRVGALGALLFTLGNLWWIWRIGLDRDYVGDWLPAMVIGGIGVGLILPSFTIAATATLPPARLATGIGAQKLFMQIGATLGVSGFVAILGTPAPEEVLGAFDATWAFIVILTVAAALALIAIRRPTKVASGEQGAPADAKARIAEAPAG